MTTAVKAIYEHGVFRPVTPETDLAVFRPGDASWWILRSSDGTIAGRAWGLPTDKPVVGSPR